MDIIEIPRSDVDDTPTLYMNSGNNNWRAAGIALTENPYKRADRRGRARLRPGWLDGSGSL
ncbi:hypothetical protein [Candidatus Pantoea persica]|uniref:hypothetical protein n=1 Tax=Candidatus Pantoea persica TaxID=2518128 RepID=UPI00215D61BA|nr:hypothetical protein [Candidatus Pantoea persica]